MLSRACYVCSRAMVETDLNYESKFIHCKRRACLFKVKNKYDLNSWISICLFKKTFYDFVV